MGMKWGHEGILCSFRQVKHDIFHTAIDECRQRCRHWRYPPVSHFPKDFRLESESETPKRSPGLLEPPRRCEVDNGTRFRAELARANVP